MPRKPKQTTAHEFKPNKNGNCVTCGYPIEYHFKTNVQQLNARVSSIAPTLGGIIV